MRSRSSRALTPSAYDVDLVDDTVFAQRLLGRRQVESGHGRAQQAVGLPRSR